MTWTTTLVTWAARTAWAPPSAASHRWLVEQLVLGKSLLEVVEPVMEVVVRVHQVLAAPGHQLELQLSPYKTEPGDCGVLMVR